MTYQQACERSGIPKSEAEILLADLLGSDRAWLIAHGTDEMPENIGRLLISRVMRRTSGEPVAYITGHQEFFGRTFIVDKNVLIPRPSTEALIELALDVLAGKVTDDVRDADTEIIVFAKLFADPKDVRIIVDVGTGSGCIAVTLAMETDRKIIATDLSRDALDIAKKNAKKFGAAVEFREGKDLEPVKDIENPFLVVSNPPYIPDNTELTKDVIDFEPCAALFGGRDGADVLREIVEQAKAHPMCRGVILECGAEQRELCFPVGN